MQARRTKRWGVESHRRKKAKKMSREKAMTLSLFEGMVESYSENLSMRMSISYGGGGLLPLNSE